MSLQPWSDYFVDTGSWNNVAVSADGSAIVAVAVNSRIHLSTDGGVSFNVTGPSSTYPYSGVALNAAGQKIFACASSGYIFYTSNGGTLWQTSSVYRNGVLLTSFFPLKIACSDDGVTVVFVDSSFIYISVDSGQTFNNILQVSLFTLDNIRISGNGATIAATARSQSNLPANVYLSQNAGATFQPLSFTGVTAWQSIAINSDGTSIYLTSRSSSLVSFLYRVITGARALSIQAITTTPSTLSSTTCVATTNATGNIIALSVFLDSSATNIRGNVLYLSNNSGATWETRVITTHVNYTGRANQGFQINSLASYDGQSAYSFTLVQAQQNSVLNITRDGGLSWTGTLNLGGYIAPRIAITSTGSRIFYAFNQGFIRQFQGGEISIFDSTGLPFGGNNSYNWIALSNDDNYLFVAMPDYIYSYSLNDPSAGWKVVFNSANESFMRISSDLTGGNLFITTSTGVSTLVFDDGTGNYTRQVKFTGVYYQSLCSFDFSILACFGNNNNANISIDGGVNWIVPTLPVTAVQSYNYATMSGTGNYIYFYSPTNSTRITNVYRYENLDFTNPKTAIISDVSSSNSITSISTDFSGDTVAVSTTQYIYMSSDYGATFTQRIPAGSGNAKFYYTVQLNSLPLLMARDGTPTDGQYVATVSNNGSIFQSTDKGLSCYLRGTVIRCFRDNTVVEVPIEKVRKGDMVVSESHPDGIIGVEKVVFGLLNTNFSKPLIYRYDDGQNNLFVLGGHSFLYDSLESAQKMRRGVESPETYKGVLPVYEYHHVLASDHIHAQLADHSQVRALSKGCFVEYFHIILKGRSEAIYANNVLTESMGLEYFESLGGEMIEYCPQYDDDNNDNDVSQDTLPRVIV